MTLPPAPAITIEVTNNDGSTQRVGLSLSIATLTLKQAVALEEQIGADNMGALMRGEDEPLRLPTVVRALLWVQLRSHFPELAIDEFDLDLGNLIPEE